jgi:hypothetical protein
MTRYSIMLIQSALTHRRTRRWNPWENKKGEGKDTFVNNQDV